MIDVRTPFPRRRLRAAAGFVVAAAGLALASPAAAQLEVELFTDQVDDPVRIVSPPGDDRLFVVEQGGLIKIFDQAGASLGVFLDASDSTVAGGERGLLGLAFPPDYAQSGRFYINYTDLAGDTHVARLAVSDADSNQADPGSWETILFVAQPYPNHNGGHLAFGADGYLYVGLGDGGDADDPEERAQDLGTLLGKMLRLDVSTETGYAIPADNPFVGVDGEDEIWALGLRNPWSYAFDSLSGDLYIADVGQNFWEEVDVQPDSTAGGWNFGWDIMEGAHCHEPLEDCEDSTLVLPVYEYAHTDEPPRCSISGGQVYRGAQLPEDVQGAYFFADWCSGEIWSLRWDGQGGVSEVTDWTADLAPAGGFQGIVFIGRDDAGELYVVDRDGDAIYRVVPVPLTGVGDAPRPAFALAQNAPNPFNPRTEIAFSVARDGAVVELRVYDLAGQLVRTLRDEPLPAGEHRAVWDGTDARGRRAPSGVYLYRLAQDGVALQRAMVMLK